MSGEGGPTNSHFFSSTNSVNARYPMPDSGVSASEEVTLPAIPGNRSRDRNIHPRGRETIGDRRNYSVSALLLPVAHAVARAIFLPFSPSISFHLLFPSAHCLPTLYPPSFHFLFLPLAWPRYICLPIPHPSYEAHKSPISLSLSPPFPHLHPSIRSPGYTGRLSSPWPPSPSPFFGVPPRSLASAGNSARRSPRRIAREHGIPPFLQCPVILKNTPAK